MNQNSQNNNTNLLDEIFLKPSVEIKTNRFEATTDTARCNGPCNGNCGSAIVA